MNKDKTFKTLSKRQTTKIKDLFDKKQFKFATDTFSENMLINQEIDIISIIGGI